MANKTIFQLPEQTGKTNDDVLAIVNSANTTTSKIKVSTLLTGASPIVKGNGTNNLLPDYLPLSAITSAATRCILIGTTGSTIPVGSTDCAIIGGKNNTNRGTNTTFIGGTNNSMNYGDNIVIAGGNNHSNEQDGNFIGGGTSNIISVYGSGIIAGFSHLNRSMWSFMGGGYDNEINAYNQQGNGIVGGTNNLLSNTNYAFMGGGDNNDILASSTNGFIGGGGTNTLSGATHAAIIGGANNSIFGNFSIVNGGQYNEIYAGSTYSFIAGGQSNRIYSSGRWCAVVGGNTNHISGTTDDSVIVGGASNIISGTTWSGIFAGYGNRLNSPTTLSVILGGTNNTMSGSSVCEKSGILAGQLNIMNGAEHAAIIAGSGNTLSHDRSVIIGGSGLTSTEAGQVLVPNLKISGQTSGNFYDSGSGTTQTIDWNRGNLQRINLTGNTSITLDNLKPGGTYMLYMNNGGTHSISSVSATGYTFKYETDGLPTITHNSTDLFVFDVFGTSTCYVRYHADFK